MIYFYSFHLFTVETSRTKLSEEDVTPAPRRRLIKADLNLRLSNSFEEEDDDIVLARRENALRSIPRSSLPSNVAEEDEDDDDDQDNVFSGKVCRKKTISYRRSSSSYSSSSSSAKSESSSHHPPARAVSEKKDQVDDLLDRPTTDTTPRRKFSFRNREYHELITSAPIIPPNYHFPPSFVTFKIQSVPVDSLKN